MELHQKTLLEKRSFFLLPNKLKIYFKDLKGEHEDYISYEAFKGDAKISCSRNSKFLFISLAMMAFSICILLQSLSIENLYYVLFPLTLALFSGFLYLYRQENYIILETYDCKRVIFFRNKPNQRALERFLAQLWSHRKKYLREKYFYIDYKNNLKQQTDRLRWLLEQHAITKAEYMFAQEDWIIDRSYQSH